MTDTSVMKELKVICGIGFRRDRIQISFLILGKFKPINYSAIAPMEFGRAHFRGILTPDVFDFKIMESTFSVVFRCQFKVNILSRMKEITL